MNQRNHKNLTGRKVIPLPESQMTNYSTVQPEVAERLSASYVGQSRKIVLGIIGVLALVLTGYPMIQTLTHSKEIAQNYAVSQKAHEQAIQQNRAVQQEYQKVQDPEYLAEIARRDYYYSKPGEIIFDLGEGNDQTDAGLFQHGQAEEELEKDSINE